MRPTRLLLLLAVTLFVVPACAGLVGFPDVPDIEDGGGDGVAGDSTTEGSGSSSGSDSGSSSGHDSGSSSGSDSGSSSASDAGGTCVIGGTSYASGGSSPTNACQTCQPGVSMSAFSGAADGTTCGSGEICHTGVCGSGCEIAGAYYAGSKANPNNACQSCQPGMSTSTWSNLADGTGCGNGQVCSAGSCGTQCDIGGTVYASGAPNPASACQSCQPGTSTTAWTTVAPGTSCGSGEVCNGSTCASGCYVGMTFVSPGPNPANVCQTCTPGASTTAWTSTDGVNAGCPSGEVCNGSPASCGAGCWVGGAFYAPKATANGGCEICMPGTSVSSWTNVTGAASCPSGEVCNGGSCAAGCSIGGVFYASGATGNSGCESCVPGTSTSQWTNAADGMTCGNGQICSGGACGTECDIGGTVHSSGAVNPADPCQTCQPGMSTTGWTNDANETSCGSGNICYAGACVACAPAQTKPVACGNCGTDTQTCVAGAWQDGTCQGQGGCAPGGTRTGNTYGTQTCSSSCGYGSCSCPTAPTCTPGATQCSGAELQTCDTCGQWGVATACGSGRTCQGNVCGVTCTKPVTSALIESYTGPALTILYEMVGGGGGVSDNGADIGGGGGGGGSSAILVNGGLQQYAAGGAADVSATPVSGSFDLSGGASLTVYVGGGAGGCCAFNAGGGGGGSGFFGGGGGGGTGTGAAGGKGGGTAGGAGGTAVAQGQLGSNGSSGLSLQGGNGGSANSVGGGGGGAGGGEAGGSGSTAGGGGGGGGVGSGGGGGDYFSGAGPYTPGPGGADGANGSSDPGGGPGGLGASTWASSTTLPAAAGATGAPGAFVSGGNAGLVILTYFEPGGTCSL